MQDQGAGVESDQDVFRAAVDTAHGLAADGVFEMRDDGPAQAALADDCLDHAPLQQSGRDAAFRRFYFRKLGRRRLGRSGYLIFDSL
jgi:hypothetical protein